MIIFFIASSITVVYSLATNQLSLTFSLIPYFISSLLYLCTSFIGMNFIKTNLASIIFNVLSLLIHLTILFCAMVYDGIVDWSYAYAFIPLWVYFFCIAIRDLYCCLAYKECIKVKNKSDDDIYEDIYGTVFYTPLDIIFFIITILIFLRFIGMNIYIFWVFFPFYFIHFCYLLYKTCRFMSEMKRAHIVEHKQSTTTPEVITDPNAPTDETSTTPEVTTDPTAETSTTPENSTSLNANSEPVDQNNQTTTTDITNQN